MENNATRGRLRELHGSGYEIIDGQPNIIGWTIRDTAGQKIGVVDDLLFDEDQQKVRYIVANLKDNGFSLEKRKVLVPIGIAELHETEDDVLVPQVSSWQLRALPTYRNNVTDSDEQEVYTIFSSSSSSSQPVSSTWQKPQNFYEHENFNQDSMYRKRRSGDMKDKPIERKFKMRENRGSSEFGNGNRAGSDDYSRSGEMQQDSIAASNRRSSQNYSDNQDSSDTHPTEKLLSKIKRVQSELDEIERDLRNTRGI